MTSRIRVIGLAGAIVALLIALFPRPSGAITIEYQDSNTQVIEHYPSGNIEDPSLGTQLDGTTPGCPPAGDGTVREWRDADSGGAPDWIPTGSVSGSAEQAWLSGTGTSITTTTTVPSRVVAFHIEGDYNDGRVELRVDAVLAARIDMYDAGNDRTVVVVGNLPYATHTLVIEVIGSGGGGGSDVEVFGASVLGCASQVPAAGPWGYVAVAFLLAAIGGGFIRRRIAAG